MSLADFARQIGISPAMARQWKKRGRIVERDNSIGFELLGGPADVVQRYVALCDSRATGRGGVIKPYGPGNPRPRGISPLGVCDENDPRRFEPESVTAKRDNGVTRELAQDSRLCRREDSESSLNPESHLESCAGCKALGDRVTTLERDIAELRGRIEGAERQIKFPLFGDTPEIAGERARPIDPPGPEWGA